MSKKIASGSNKLVLEVTYGKGAFMRNIEKAEELSKIMKEIGKLAGIETVCVTTNMNQPLGKTIGNSLEIEEANNALLGKMEEDVEEVVLEIVAQVLKLAGYNDNLEENKNKAKEVIANGKAHEKFEQLIAKQNGDISYLKNIPKAKYIVEVKSEKEGYITELDAEVCGRISLMLGAGRIEKKDDIDHLARNCPRKENRR